MNDPESVLNGRKLSREDIAKLEIGHTEISKAKKWFIVLFFVLLITIYPALQICVRQPFAHWRNAGSVQQSIKAYETAIEDSSLLRQWLLSPAQRFALKVFKMGNEKVIVGKDGWLFYTADHEYLVNRGFMEPEVLSKRVKQGVQPDPVKAIIDFNRQLQSRGIRLIVLPVPVKPMIYPDKLNGSKAPLQNPSFAKFKQQLEQAGITVIDIANDLAAMREAGIEPYLKTDTHWTPTGMELAARKTAEAIKGTAIAAPGFIRSQVTASGDIAAMLNLPDVNRYFPAETVSIADYNCRMQRNSPVLLLGDSFVNIYSLPAMKWGGNSGFAEAWGAYLGAPVDAILRNDAGAFATRQLLSNEMKRSKDRLAGKKVVVYEFAIRELTNGDWKMLDISLGEARESKFISVDAPRVVTATVWAVSSVPRPNSAPYKDHVMSLHLGDIDGGSEQALVYTVSMRDNVWTPAAGLRLGDTVKLQLTPWSEAENQYGAWNRSEFDNEELMLEEPIFGTLAE